MQTARPRLTPLWSTPHAHGWLKRMRRRAGFASTTAESPKLWQNSSTQPLVKRFTAKEERRRVSAAVFGPSCVKATRVGFENHLNYFHTRRNGIDESLARGLAVFLNSTLVDEFFRQFSGHTQVNASDLRNLPYPSQGELKQLGRSCRDMGDQAALDSALKKVIQSS